MISDDPEINSESDFIMNIILKNIILNNEQKNLIIYNFHSKYLPIN